MDTGNDRNDVEVEDVETEFMKWKSRWRNVTETDRPDTCLAALAACDIHFYPNLHLLLKIFASFPGSTATPECTFSAMTILKTYLRSTLSDENLQGLSMAYIHTHLNINIDDIISNFALKNRRLQFH